MHFDFQPISKEAQCPQGRSAETGLKDRVAPELVTGDFLEDWHSNPIFRPLFDGPFAKLVQGIGF